jgi:putative DNA primase/helicase
MTTIDLVTGTERPSDPKDYITKIAAAAAAKPGTPHPLWDGFLKRVTNDNYELTWFLRRFTGYCMTGETSEHVLLFLYGTGANGKGVFVNTVSGIFGDYAIVAPMELFMASKHERHPTEIAKLRGARLVVAHETEKGRHWDTTKIKMLTSDDKLTGRFMRQDFFDFKPTHKLIIAGNHKPVLRAVDEAMRRRLLLVPFTVQIPPDERDPDLVDKLKPEWPAILRWMVDGCLEWRRDGLKVPDIVREASDSYFEEQDIMGLWLEEWTDRDINAFTTTVELFKVWKWWCEKGNHYVGTERSFSDDLVDHSFERERRNPWLQRHIAAAQRCAEVVGGVIGDAGDASSYFKRYTRTRASTSY